MPRRAELAFLPKILPYFLDSPAGRDILIIHGTGTRAGRPTSTRTANTQTPAVRSLFFRPSRLSSGLD